MYGGYDMDAHDVDLAPDPETVGMEIVPTFPDPAILDPDAPNHATWWACHAMSEQCVAGCVWGVRPGGPWRRCRYGGRPESSGMETVPMDPDPAIPALDGTNHGTW